MISKAKFDRIMGMIEELTSMLNIASSDVIFCSYSFIEDLDFLTDVLKKSAKDISFHELYYEKGMDLATEILRVIKTMSFRFEKIKSQFTQKKLVFSIFELEKLLDTSSIETLNLYRDLFLRTNYTILIWFKDSYIKRIALEAPDFWRIRTKVFFFPCPTNTIKGKVTDLNSNPFCDLTLQAIDINNGDLLGSSRAETDGLFEIPFYDSSFNDIWLEKKPKIFLIVRNANGQIVHRTEQLEIEFDEKKNEIVNSQINIILDSIEKKTDLPNGDFYWDNRRILDAFTSLSDTPTFKNTELDSNFRLLIGSINAWLVYTNGEVWKKIGYDGPQVPRRPWQSPNHSHKLSWE